MVSEGLTPHAPTDAFPARRMACPRHGLLTEFEMEKCSHCGLPTNNLEDEESKNALARRSAAILMERYPQAVLFSAAIGAVGGLGLSALAAALFFPVGVAGFFGMAAAGVYVGAQFVTGQALLAVNPKALRRLAREVPLIKAVAKMHLANHGLPRGD
jgi:hypothetical protein